MERFAPMQRLSPRAFAPFGEVLSMRDAEPQLINAGTSRRYNGLGHIVTCGYHAGAIISLFRSQPRHLPMRVQLLERHPLGTQAFYPLSGHAYLILVAPPLDFHNADSPPDLGQLTLFRADPDQGINLGLNVWHHPLLAMDAESEFLVVDREGDGVNCVEFRFDPDLAPWIRPDGLYPEGQV